MKLLDNLRRSRRESVGPGVTVSLHHQLPTTVSHQNKRRDDRSKSMGPGGLLPGVFAAVSATRTTTTTTTAAPCSPEVSSMLRFLHGKNHMSIMYVLLSRDVDASKLIQDCTKALGEPFLHHMLKTSQPPVELVQLVLAKQMLGGEEDSAAITDNILLDKEGRTALHVAAAYGCEYKIIQTLLEERDGRILAAARDNQNRTPLHWACYSYCLSTTSCSSSSSRKLDAVKTLVTVNPAAVTHRDVDGHTPLDMVRMTTHHNATSSGVHQLIELLEAACHDAPLRSVSLESGMNCSAEVTAISCDSCDDDDLSSLEWEGDGQDSLLFDTERLKL